MDSQVRLSRRATAAPTTDLAATRACASASATPPRVATTDTVLTADLAATVPTAHLAATAPTADLAATAPTADLAVTTAAPTTGATEKDMTTRSKRKSDNTEDETGSNKVFSREAKKRLQERIDRLTDEQLDSVLNFLSFDSAVDEDGVFHVDLDDLPQGKQDDLVKLVDAQLAEESRAARADGKAEDIYRQSEGVVAPDK